MQRAGDLTKLFGDFDVEGFEQLLILQFNRLLGKILRQRFFSVSSFARDAVVPIQKFVLSGEERLLDLLLIHV
ncbi:MAG: hypothetical protein NT024_15135 [Proteobacteria bacterium]|nr:hypothetical protein [Pseudomonadota bacterium]